MKQCAEEEVERELAEMNVSLEQFGGWKRRRRAGLQFMAQRPVCASISRYRLWFIEGVRAFVLQSWWKGWRWVVGG